MVANDDVVAMVTMINKADADDGVQGADLYVQSRQRSRWRRVGSLLLYHLCRRHRRQKGKLLCCLISSNWQISNL